MQYFWLTWRHKWFVLLAGLKTKVPLWRLLVHDWTKFFPAELPHYQRQFFGKKLRVGSRIEIDSFEGVHGPAIITEERKSDGARFKVRMKDGSQEFWAHDFEVVELGKDPYGFIRCWVHHQNHNPHHWEYWIPRTGHNRCTPPYPDNVPIQMSEWAVREMVADWIGASRAYEGKWPVRGEWSWLKNNYPKIRVHPSTAELITSILTEMELL